MVWINNKRYRFKYMAVVNYFAAALWIYFIVEFFNRLLWKV